MRIVIGNFCGSVGKSMVAKELLAPRLANAEVVNIESINSGADTTGSKISFRDYAELTQKLMFMGEDQNIIIDIGASNIEGVIDEMYRLDGAHHDVDLWVVPTNSDKKNQDDSLNFIRCLTEMGVDQSKIVVIRNRAVARDPNERLFQTITEGAASLGVRVISEYLFENQVYQDAAKLGKRIADLARENEADWRKRGIEAKSAEERATVARIVTAVRGSTRANDNLDRIYDEIGV